jgi:hypothetical protein
MTDWNAAWEQHRKGMAELHAICNSCGGSSISSCACAKARWINEQRAFPAPFPFGAREPAFNPHIEPKETKCFMCETYTDATAPVVLLNKPRDLCKKCINKLM